MTQDEEKRNNKGLAILKKMGFRERIGRFENGILQPISPKKTLGRQGLGYDNTLESTACCSETRPFHQVADKGENGIEKQPEINSSISVFTKRKRLSKDVNQNHENNFLSCPLLESRQERVRCGILVDFDVFISNHETRRMQALKETLESFSETEYDWDSLQWLLEDEESDWTLLQRVICFLYSKFPDDDEISSIYEIFESSLMRQPLERDTRAQQFCETLSEKPLVRVGILHKGSRIRMNEEMRYLSVRELQMCRYAVSLDAFAQVPYNEQWIELCRRLGVCPQDSYALFAPHKTNTDQPSKLEVGAILSNIQPIRWNVISMNSSDPSLLSHSGDLHESMKGQATLRNNISNTKFQSVLARYSSDRLWYLATAIQLNESKYYWVTYQGWKNSELREEEDIELVSQEKEEIFKANNYQGLDTTQKQNLLKDTKVN
ncbi:hypothetical protein GpartN1_g6548.t1 [Galdieria partita]|uniref:G-patch domain-containing protein n=1 Tax=Galdieria partita TaxID=83374 RepID=A0A9C7Q3V9_9RHOD|nr:hypothetical protein GpartN1_g6548.t1 [Galdieria partita]